VTSTGRVIYLKEIMEIMMREKVLRKLPLEYMNINKDLPEGSCGGILARAGVGKTAMLVQLALNAMLQGKDVLHVSLLDPVQKVSLWYKERFQALIGTDQPGIYRDLWDELQNHRFIMTFQVGRFSAPVFEERLTDLTAQGIFHPQLILIDGYRFEGQARESLSALKFLAKEHGSSLWFTVHIHHDVPIDSDGMPENINGLRDLFDKILLLEMDGSDLHAGLLGHSVGSPDAASIILDPTTLMPREQMKQASH
jgi:hypothetical protein